MLSIRALRASSTRDSWKRLTFGSAFVGWREMSMKGHCKLQISGTVIDTVFFAIKGGLHIKIRTVEAAKCDHWLCFHSVIVFKFAQINLSQITLLYLVHSLIVIILLMLSVSICPKVVTCLYNLNLVKNSCFKYESFSEKVPKTFLGMKYKLITNFWNGFVFPVQL